MLEFRDYQRRAIDDTLDAWLHCDSLLGVAPARSGKTIIFLEVLASVLGDGRAIILSHTESLMRQAVEKIDEYFPEFDDVGMVGYKRTDFGAKVIAGLVPSVAVNIYNILNHGKITHLIIDEGHRAVADLYQFIIKVLRHFYPGLKVLVVTATPIRADGRGLIEVVDEVAFMVTFDELIDEGYLVRPQLYEVHLDVDASDLEVRDGDFTAGSLGRVLNTEAVMKIAFDEWYALAGDQQTLIYTATVEQAENVADYWRSMGIAAEHVSGHTKDPDKVQKALANGDIQVVPNALLWSEGTDIAAVGCVVMLRVTRSAALYTQMVSRCLTPYPGKTEGVIIDLAPKVGRTIVTGPDVLGDLVPGKPSGHPRLPLSRDTVLRPFNPDFDIPYEPVYAGDLMAGAGGLVVKKHTRGPNVGQVAFQRLLKERENGK